MELVERDRRLRQGLLDPPDERRRHVATNSRDLLRLPAVSLQVGSKLCNRLRSSSLGHIKHPRAVQVHEQAHVVMPPLGRRLINTHPFDTAVVAPLPGLLYVVLE